MEFSNSPTTPPDPDSSEWLCEEIPTDEKPSGNNTDRVCDLELDQLWKTQLTQMDFNERQQTFYKITKMIYDKMYWLGIWQDPDQFMVGKRLLNVKISGTTPFYNVIDWDLTP